MKLKKEYIEKLLGDFHYELTREQLEQDWHLDKTWPYYKEKKAFNFRAADNSWLEIPTDDMVDAFINNEGGDLRVIGAQEYIESSFYAGKVSAQKKDEENFTYRYMGTVEPRYTDEVGIEGGTIKDDALAFIYGAIKKYGNNPIYFNDLKLYIRQEIDRIGL